jgi:hypothetical protein
MNQVIETRENIRSNDVYVEAGDLANEVGKRYMKQLWKSIERHSSLNEPILYFISMIKKNPKNSTEILLYIMPCKNKFKLLRESCDHWQYDYKKNELTLLWSIPHRTEMKNFLRAPEKYNKDIIRWINDYIAQEHIDLNDDSSSVIV